MRPPPGSEGSQRGLAGASIQLVPGSQDDRTVLLTSHWRWREQIVPPQPVGLFSCGVEVAARFRDRFPNLVQISHRLLHIRRLQEPHFFEEAVSPALSSFRAWVRSPSPGAVYPDCSDETSISTPTWIR